MVLGRGVFNFPNPEHTDKPSARPALRPRMIRGSHRLGSILLGSQVPSEGPAALYPRYLAQLLISAFARYADQSTVLRRH